MTTQFNFEGWCFSVRSVAPMGRFPADCCYKELGERSVVDDLLSALGHDLRQCCVDSVPTGQDPTDVVVKNGNALIGVEVVELIDEVWLQLEIRHRLQIGQHFDCQEIVKRRVKPLSEKEERLRIQLEFPDHNRIVAILLKLINKKSSKLLKWKCDYTQRWLAIHTDQFLPYQSEQVWNTLLMPANDFDQITLLLPYLGSEDGTGTRQVLMWRKE